MKSALKLKARRAKCNIPFQHVISTVARAWDKHNIRKDKQVRGIQPPVPTCRIIAMITHRNQYILYRMGMQEDPESAENAPTSIKLLFKTLRSSQQPRISLKRGALKGT